MKRLLLSFLTLCIYLSFIILCFPNNSYATQERQNIDTKPLLDITYQQIDASLCQNITQVDIPTIDKYPLKNNFDVSSINLPFSNYFNQNYRLPPIEILCFFIAFIILLKIKKLVLNDFLDRTIGFFIITSLSGSILIFLAWANLLYLNSNVTEKEQLNTYIKISPYITKSYELLLPWVWQDHPALKVNAYLVSLAIKNSFLSGDLLTAAKYVDYDSSTETLALREGVLLNITQNEYQQKRFQDALIYSKKALKLTGSERAYQTNQIIRAISAVDMAIEEKFEQSKSELTKIDSAWTDDLSSKSWNAVAYLHLRSLSKNTNQQLSNHNIATILKSYLQSFSKYSKLDTPYQLECLYSAFLENMGETELKSNNVENAITLLEASESLVKNQPSTNTLLTDSYYKNGLNFSNQRKPKEAIVFLEKAFNKSPENEGIKRVLSVAYMNDATDEAYFGNVDKSKKLSEKAKSIFLFNGIDKISADISIINGQTYMRHGDWENARNSFKEVSSKKTPDKFKLSSVLLQDSYIAPNRLAKINEVKNWQDKVPNVTGMNCYFDDDSNKCSKIEIFDDERRVGMALSDMSRVEFEENGKDIVIKDTDGNGQLDTFEITEGKKRRVLVETDGDYRLDGELLFDEKGVKIDEKHYSGRALIRIPYGVVKDTTNKENPCSYDCLSNPDPFLKVQLNNHYVGQTDIKDNDRFPYWNQAFIQNYRKDDCIYITMWDYDPLDPDDFIDRFKTCDFSQSDVLYGDNDNAAIQLEVKPTTLPEGVYDVKSLEGKSNPWSYPDFITDDPKLKAKIDKAKKDDEASNTIAKITAQAAPYVIKPMLGLEEMKGFSGFLFGQGLDAAISALIEHQLIDKGVEKQSLNPVINE